MQAQGAFLRVGLLIVLGAVGVLGVVLFLGGDRWRSGHAYESYFTESVQGLEVGAPIKFRGVTLGRVSRIGLVSAEYGLEDAAEMNAENYRQVFVRYTIDPTRVGRLPDTAAASRTGLRARIASQGITGLAYIELDFVDPQQYPARPVPWVAAAEVLPSMPSTLSQVQDAAQHFLAELNKVDLAHLSEQIIGLIEDVRESLKSGDVHVAIAQMIRLLQSVEANVERADLPALIGELRATTGAARDLVATVHTTVEQAQIPALMGDVRATATAIHALADRLAQAAAKLPPLLANIDAAARRAGAGTADLQQALVPLLRDTQAVVTNLRETTEALRRYPAGALLGGPPPRGLSGGLPGGPDREPERAR